LNSLCAFQLLEINLQSRDQMPLEIKKECERCGGALTAGGEAYICTYECTFCSRCTEEMNSVCPNCGGELVRRPRAGKIDRAISGDA
jgi:hypothetical protein